MTDNVTVNSVTYGTDEIAGTHYQKVIPMFGVDGVATRVSAIDPLPVTTPDDTFTVTPTLVSGAYTANAILFVATLIDANTSRGAGVPVVLNSVFLADKSANTAEILLLFFDSNVTIGTINTTISLSDANALKGVAAFKIAKSDYGPLTASSIADPDFRPRQMKPVTTEIYVAGVVLEAATYTNGDLQFRFGFAR